MQLLGQLQLLSCYVSIAIANFGESEEHGCLLVLATSPHGNVLQQSNNERTIVAKGT